jgi:Na+-driven multidrug efflux pump
VLDPILIFGLGLDLTGAALASVAARLVIAGTALIPIFRHHGGLVRPGIPEMSVAFVPIVTIAAPAILTQLASPRWDRPSSPAPWPASARRRWRAWPSSAG